MKGKGSLTKENKKAHSRHNTYPKVFRNVLSNNRAQAISRR